MQAQQLRVVTPEAVVLNVQTAGLGSRVLARALDVLIQVFVLFLLLNVTGLVATSSSGAGVAIVVVDLVLVTLVVFGYPILCETLWRGRTVGKAALGLRVVTKEGAPIRFRHAVVRGVLALIDIYVLGPEIGILAILLSRNEQRLGDMAAGTLVVRERASGRAPAPAVFYPPPGWERYVATLDVSGMTTGEYEAARAFLLRASQLTPVARVDLAARLAGPIAARLRQIPPASMSPELWLACAAAAYQHRGRPWEWGPPARAGWGPPARAGWGPPARAGWGSRPAWGPPPTAASAEGFSPPA